MKYANYSLGDVACALPGVIPEDLLLRAWHCGRIAIFSSSLFLSMAHSRNLARAVPGEIPKNRFLNVVFVVAPARTSRERVSEIC